MTVEDPCWPEHSFDGVPGASDETKVLQSQSLRCALVQPLIRYWGWSGNAFIICRATKVCSKYVCMDRGSKLLFLAVTVLSGVLSSRQVAEQDSESELDLEDSFRVLVFFNATFVMFFHL